MKKKKDNGFTLIELLATIVLLSLVVGITIYVVVGNINSSKEKTYAATIKNIEQLSGNYMQENSDRLFYLTLNESQEYSCVTVQNLIDVGYFDDNIVNSYIKKDVKVSKDDYVYLLRDSESKAVIKNEYLGVNSVDCEKAVTALGDINIKVVPDNDEWSYEKEVTINYKLSNLNDFRELDSYKYNYSYDGDYEELVDEGVRKVIKVLGPGKLSTNITKIDDEITSKELDISKVDRNAPVISIDKINGLEEEVEREITVTISDDESGIDTSGVLEYGFSTSKTEAPTYEKADLTYNKGYKSITYKIRQNGLQGTYYLWLRGNFKDLVGNTLDYQEVYGEYLFINKFMVIVNKDSGVERVIGEGEYIVNSQVTLEIIPKEYYKVTGFTGYANVDSTTYTFKMPVADVIIDANTVKYKCSSGSLVHDGSKGYICTDNSSSAINSYTCGCTTCASPYTCMTSSSGCGSYYNYQDSCPMSGTCWGYHTICVNKSCSVTSYEHYAYSCTKWYSCTKTAYRDAPCYGTCYNYYTCGCKTCYSCNSGWTKYSGSDSSLVCYKSATT